METRTYTVYKFDELPEKARQKALERYYDINVDNNWWDCTYDDAANIGLKITGFDIDRGSYCTGEFTQSAEEVARAILKDHGSACETYATAAGFLATLDELRTHHAKEIEADDYENFELALEEAEKEFLYALRQDYLSILRRECEYLTSEEAVVETFRANDYDFTDDGKID